MIQPLLLFTNRGPLLILSTYGAINDRNLLEELAAKGISKFMAWELDEETVRERYGAHYFVVTRDLKDIDDFRIVDHDGSRIFERFRFDELGEATMHEGTD